MVSLLLILIPKSFYFCVSIFNLNCDLLTGLCWHVNTNTLLCGSGKARNFRMFLIAFKKTVRVEVEVVTRRD